MSEFKAPCVPALHVKSNKDVKVSSLADLDHALSDSSNTGQSQVPDQTEIIDEKLSESVSDGQELTKEKKPSDANIAGKSQRDNEKYEKILASLNYCAPKGSTLPTSSYHLEVLKDGSIVDHIKLEGKPYFIIGRVPGCDVVAENPTTSRLHAILQYIGKASKFDCDRDSGNESDSERLSPGFYLYDLGSTHGTFLNKNQLYPKRFYRIHVGHVMKLGNSARLYIVGGPSEDEEEESTKTVSELKQEKLEKELEKMKRVSEGSAEVSPLVRSVEDEGISWGMAEDAEEESDLRENPFAMDFDSSEVSFDNPKRTLRGWFEREGYDLEYDVREKAAGHFICRVDLPLDGPDQTKVFAEVELKGKKKEVVAQCALQACQILDKYGVLRQSNHDSRLKRKKRDWADEDYYSSDDDNFLDRTGTIEKKREKRMREAGVVKQETETYDSLMEKENKYQKEINELQKKISKAEKKSDTDEEVDPLDAFMMDLKTNTGDIKKLKSKLRELLDLQSKNRKLLKIAKPSVVFPSVQSSLSSEQESQEIEVPVESNFDSPNVNPLRTQKTALKSMFGPRIQFKSISAPKAPGNCLDSGGLEEDQKSQHHNSEIEPESKPLLSKVVGPDRPAKLAEPESFPTESTIELDAEAHVLPRVEDGDEAVVESAVTVKVKKPRVRKPKGKSAAPAEEYDDTDPDYCVWVPPVGQKGDGKISLNEKLGY